MVRGERNAFRNADAHAGIGTIGNAWLDVGSVKRQFLIEYSIVAALQRFPVGYSLVPICTFRGELTAFEIVKGRFVRSDETATRPHLDRQVAKRQTAFHRQGTHDITRILDKVSRSTGGCQFRHQIERHILGCHTLLQLTVDTDAH